MIIEPVGAAVPHRITVPTDPSFAGSLFEIFRSRVRPVLLIESANPS
jgi:hypothetical protein